jgi:transcriptional regulator with XRE-family HTH domain
MHIASIHHDEVRDYGFADKALALRQRAGLTQRDLAARLGVSYKAIGAWEAGVSFPGAERLKQLIALALERSALTAGREAEEAAALWGAVRGAASRRTAPFDPYWFASLRSAGGTAAPAAPPLLAVVPPASATPDDLPVAMAAMPTSLHDWGEAPEVPVVQGRAQELATLARWVREECCRLVLVLGEGGIGKTTLAARLAHDLVPEFAAVHWRSLRNAPAVEDWLAGAISALSATQASPPEGLEARLGLLLELLRARRVLLVLDNLETVLEPGVPDVRYREGYEGYGEVLRRLGESAHQGCLLVTSREQPLREDHTAVRALRLQGLGVDEGRALLEHRDLAGDAAAWRALIARYAGNPLALQTVGETVGAVCGGDIAAFLAQDVAVFGDIRQLLDEQIARLSVPEQVVLSWLSVEREPVGFAELVTYLGPVVGRAEVVEAVEALARRSLLEPGGRGTFTLQPMMLEYSAKLVERAAAAGQSSAAEGLGQELCAAQPGASGRAASAGRTPRGGTSFARRKARVVRRPLHYSGTATLQEDRLMASFTRQLECLNCSQTPIFVHHTETAQRPLSQQEVATLPRDAVVTCGKCGSASVLYGWGDATPYATRGRVPRRRRSSGSAGVDAPVCTTRTGPVQK